MSNETKWTLGPWDNRTYVGITQQDNAGLYIGFTMTRDQKRREECAANAHLIAAAPDLYEALEDARGVIQALIDEGYTGYVDQRGRIDRALAKARGEQ